MFVALTYIPAHCELFVDWGDKCWKHVWQTQLTALAQHSHRQHRYIAKLQHVLKSHELSVIPPQLDSTLITARFDPFTSHTMKTVFCRAMYDAKVKEVHRINTRMEHYKKTIHPIAEEFFSRNANNHKHTARMQQFMQTEQDSPSSPSPSPSPIPAVSNGTDDPTSIGHTFQLLDTVDIAFQGSGCIKGNKTLVEIGAGTQELLTQAFQATCKSYTPTTFTKAFLPLFTDASI